MAALAGVADQMRMCRECALLGSYDAALVYFDGVAAQIHNHLRSVQDPSVHAQWVRARDELATEAQLIKDLSLELGRLREAPGSRRDAAPARDRDAVDRHSPDVWPPPPPRPLKRAPSTGGGGGVARNGNLPAWAQREQAQQQQQQQQQAGASSGATGRSNSGNGAVSPPAARAALVASRASLSREHVLGVSGLASGPAARGGLAGAPSGGDGVVSPPSSGFMAAACKADGASSFGSSVAAANGAPGARATTFGAAMSGRSMQTPGQQHGGRGGGGGLAHGALRERRPTDSGPGKAGGVSTVSGAQLLSVSTGSSGGAAMSPKSPPGKRDGATSSPLKLKRQHKPAASD